eukprot:13712250-Alexandrium_andersonii.AAC.1
MIHPPSVLARGLCCKWPSVLAAGAHAAAAACNSSSMHVEWGIVNCARFRSYCRVVHFMRPMQHAAAACTS